jgi:hypothetical protein
MPTQVTKEEKGLRGQFPGLKPPEVRFVTAGIAPALPPESLPGFIGGAEFFELADLLDARGIEP